MSPTLRFFKTSICLSALTLVSCETTIPETDTEKPSITFTVQGPNIGMQEMTNPPKDLWSAEDGTQLFTMMADSTYSFTLIVSDPGGVQRVYLSMAPMNIVLSDIVPAEAVENVAGIRRFITLSGLSSDPKTALVITGKMRMPAGSYGVPFSVEADDFGGTRGPSNQRFMTVKAFSDDMLQ